MAVHWTATISYNLTVHHCSSKQALVPRSELTCGWPLLWKVLAFCGMDAGRLRGSTQRVLVARGLASPPSSMLNACRQKC